MNRRIGAALAIIVSLTLASSSRADDDAPPPASGHFPAFRLGAFADIVLSHPTGQGKDHQTGEVDLYASSQLRGDWSFLGEVLVKSTPNSGSDRPLTHRFELNLERFYVTFNPSDRLRLEIGQIHTGIIQWNEREHRSLFLQTPIDVPAIARRESQHGAWPLHFDGAWASGRMPGSLGAEYGVGLGGARGTERDDIQPLFRRGISPAGLVLVSVAPDVLTGFQAGASGYAGRIRLRGETLRELDATLFSSFVRGGVELRGEWARMVHSDVGGPNEFVTHGWYLLASYRLPGRWKPFRPYVLMDHQTVAPGEQYLSDVQNLNAWSAGVRWDISPRLVFKSEYGSQLVPPPRARHLVRAELAIAF